jgi:DNA invertase Pin-like site-specific DNA recombinase
MQIGYARVSTDDQDTAAQVAALKAAGCERIYKEKASGGRWDRPELHRLLDQLRKGDVLVVWKLDRLSRVRNMHTASFGRNEPIQLTPTASHA